MLRPRTASPGRVLMARWILLLIAMVGCTAAPQPVREWHDTVIIDPKGAAELRAARRYYPLAVGNFWTYRTGGTDARETIRIVSADGPWFIDERGGGPAHERRQVRGP